MSEANHNQIHMPDDSNKPNEKIKAKAQSKDRIVSLREPLTNAATV